MILPFRDSAPILVMAPHRCFDLPFSEPLTHQLRLSWLDIHFFQLILGQDGPFLMHPWHCSHEGRGAWQTDIWHNQQVPFSCLAAETIQFFPGSCRQSLSTGRAPSLDARPSRRSGGGRLNQAGQGGWILVIVNHNLWWLQWFRVLIFPEGTTTDGTALIHFQ